MNTSQAQAHSEANGGFLPANISSCFPYECRVSRPQPLVVIVTAISHTNMLFLRTDLDWHFSEVCILAHDGSGVVSSHLLCLR